MQLHVVARGKIARSPEAELVERYTNRIAWPLKFSELPERGGGLRGLVGSGGGLRSGNFELARPRGGEELLGQGGGQHSAGIAIAVRDRYLRAPSAR